MTRKILLIGGSGSIGPALLVSLSTLGEVTVTQRIDPTQTRTYYDARADHETTQLYNLQFASFDIVVYSAALSSMSACETRPSESSRLNFETPTQLARAAEATGLYFVFLSSSAAAEYDGMSEPEALLANKNGLRGASTYGLHKFLAECELRKRGSALVIRPAKVAPFSWPLIPMWISELSNGYTISAFNDDYVSPIHTEALSRVVFSATAQRLTGLVEISASDRVSYFEVAKYLAARLGRSLDLVRGVSAMTLKDPRHVLSKTRLNNGRAQDLLGYAPPTSFEVVERSFFGGASLN